MDSFILTMTWLGSGYLLLPLSACLSLLLTRSGRSGQGIFLSLSLLLTMVCVHAAKLMFRRPRPVGTDLLVSLPADWSFPSAHAAQATAFFLALTLIALRVLPPFPAGFVASISLIAIALVGYSRVYLQVHYVSDVLAGVALAVLVVSGVRVWLARLSWFQSRE